jgi:hypothetical protein
MIARCAIAAGDVAIVRGDRTARKRLRRCTSYDWLAVARTWAIGDLAIGAKRTERVLTDIPGQKRCGALRGLDRFNDSDGCRARLGDAKRRWVNHRNLAYERDTKRLAVAEQRNMARRMLKGANRKSPAFLGDMLERVAAALREASHSGGYIVTATAALRPAFRPVDRVAGLLEASSVEVPFGLRGPAVLRRIGSHAVADQIASGP